MPTYGGPFDSYPIPTMEGEPTDLWHDRELSRRHYDHDHWVSDESISMRVISEDVLFELQQAAEKAPTNQPVQAKTLTLIDKDDLRNILDDLRSGAISKNAMLTLEN